MRSVITILDGVHTHFFFCCCSFQPDWNGKVELCKFKTVKWANCANRIFLLYLFIFFFVLFFLLSIALCRFSSCVHFHINGFLHIKFHWNTLKMLTVLTVFRFSQFDKFKSKECETGGWWIQKFMEHIVFREIFKINATCTNKNQIYFIWFFNRHEKSTPRWLMNKLECFITFEWSSASTCRCSNNITAAAAVAADT